MHTYNEAIRLDSSLESMTGAFSASTAVPAIVPKAASCAIGDEVSSVLASLNEAFGQPFAIVDVKSGDLVHSDYGCLACDFYERVELLAEVNRQGKPAIVEEVSPLVMLAIPLRGLNAGESLVAVGVFVDTRVASEQEITAAARAFGIDSGRALRWANDQAIWPSHALVQVAKATIDNVGLSKQVSRLNLDLADATAHADDIYDELDLLHKLTGQLHLSESEEELWRSALSRLTGPIPAQCLAIVMRDEKNGRIDRDCTEDWTLLTEGECPTSRDDLCELIRRFSAKSLTQPVLLNRSETVLPTWHVPTIRELVCVPIEGPDEPRGWLLALNHRGGPDAKFHEFGSIEIQLLRSVGTILGIHHSNLALFRDQSQLFSSSVQALTSAIDAKDRYTSGHSNRVAYFSVTLAQQLGLDKAERDTLYLAGLLHDIGKIGIDDQLLNKPGRLTNEEFEQIKLHPQLGYDILKGVQQLDQVLPTVLHHHESWDGCGYPHQLAGESIPQAARILAVADAFDAMSSDRPYRKGMSDEKIDAIMRDGAGTQWDPEVIKAFFEIRDEIRRIVEVSSCQASLTVADGVSC